MAYKPELSIQGIQKAQERNNRRIAAVRPEGAAGQAVKDAIISLHRYATQITHVGKYTGGGALKSSHRMDIDELQGTVSIDPKSVSPRRTKTKNKPVIYGIYENAHGGEHAFYDRTISEIGEQVVERAKDTIRNAVLYAK